MHEFPLIVIALLGGGVVGYFLGCARLRILLARVAEQTAEAFRQQLDLLKPACTGSHAALQLVDTLIQAANDGTVSQEALRRDIALAVEAEQVAARDPWDRSTAEALLHVTRAAACLKVVDCAIPRDRLLVQDAQDAMDRAQQALVSRTAAAAS